MKTRMMKIAALSTLCLAFTAGTVGCSGFGRANKSEKEVTAAKVKMDALKAGTEYQLAYQAFLSHDMDKASRHTDYAIGLAPEVAKPWILKGRIALENNDFQTAEASFTKVATKDPKNADAQYYLGVVAERTSHKQEALGFFKAAADLDTANDDYVIAAAETLIDLNQLSDAQTYLTEKVNTFRHSAGIRQTLGHIAMIQNNYDQALNYFGEARLLAPEDNTILEDLTRAQYEMGKYGEADSNLARLLRDPENDNRRDLRHMKARCLVHLDQPVEARKILEQLTTGDEGSSDIEAWIGYGQTAFTLRDMARVRTASSRIVALAPNRPEGFVLRGLMFRHLSKFDDAEKSFVRALMIKEEPETYVLLGLVQQSRLQNDKAIASFNKALALDPNNINARALIEKANGTMATVPAGE